MPTRRKGEYRVDRGGVGVRVVVIRDLERRESFRVTAALRIQVVHDVKKVDHRLRVGRGCRARQRAVSMRDELTSLE